MLAKMYDDTLTLDGAQRLVMTIRAFWKMKSLYPRVHLVKLEAGAKLGPRSVVYVVRSDMVNGLPR